MSITAWAVAAGFAGGLALGGAGGGLAYWSQGLLLKSARSELAGLQSEVGIANRKAKAEADAAQLMIDALSSDLAHSRKQRQIEYVHIETEIVRHTSATAVALGPRAVRLLNGMPGTGAAPARADPGRTAGDGPAPAANPGGSASERALTGYVHQVKHQYLMLHDKHTRLVQAVCTIPNVLCE